MTIPIEIKFPGTTLPELGSDQLRVVLAEGGLYLERRTDVYTTCTPVGSAHLGLAPHRMQCALHCGKIPRTLIRVMLAFFRQAYDLHRGEAALVLLYHPQRRVFRWHCPEQTVEVYYSFGRLRAYDSIAYEVPLAVPEGYVVFGDAHCHGDLSASPSAIDREDESYKDGLHLIVGRIDRPKSLDYHADFVMDGHRFTLPPTMVLADTRCRPFARAPQSWLKRIHLKRPWYSKDSFTMSSSSDSAAKGRPLFGGSES
jgi:hypothetical protein